jgi:uncharacterized protein
VIDIQNILVFIFLYIPPLIFFFNCSLKRGINKFLLIIISVAYLFLSISTQNLLPFIIVIINIRYLKKYSISAIEDYGYRIDEEYDYSKYNFNIKSFKISKGLKYAIETYGITIVMGIVITVILTNYNVNLKEQEIVRDLMKVSIDKFLYMIPIMIIFAPVVEEFTFRWLLFEKLFKPKLGIYFSAILSSLIFAMVHFNLRSIPILITIGLINCYLIEKKGYWYAVFNHLFFNSINVFLMLFQKIS